MVSPSVLKRALVVLLLGCLNSVLGALSCELVGRVEGRGLLQLMTYELGNVVVLDIGRLDNREKERIAAGHRELVDGRGTDALDRAVVIGLKGRVTMGSEMEMALRTLRENRLSKERPCVPVKARSR